MNVHSLPGSRLRLLFSRPWIIIVVIGAITAFFALQLPNIRIDNDIAAFVPEDHPDRLALERIDDVFGEDMAFSVGVELPNGTIFARNTILMIEELTERIEELDSVDTVTSLANLEIIEGTEDGMAVVPLLEEFSGSDAEIQTLKEQLLSWDLYRGLFVSDDFTSTQIVVSHDLQLENDEREYLYLEIKEILADYESPVVKFYVAGEPVITLIISRDTRRDVSFLVPLVVLVVIAVLYLVFRRVGGVVLPLITAVVSIVWTLGLMVLLDISLTLISTVIPVLLVAVGSAYGIHLINHYYHDLAAANDSDDANGTSVMSREAHRDLVLGVILQIGKPVLLAGLTTVVGFGALVTSSVEPMRTFGIFTAVGVFVAVIAALLLIPALLLMRHGVHPANSRERVQTRLQEQRRMFLEGLFEFFTASKPRILVFTVLIAVVAVFGATRVVVDNELVEYFKEDTDIRRSDQFLRDKFAGTRTFSIVVSGQEKGDLTNPEALLAMDELAQRLRQHPDVGSVVSYTDFIKRMNQVMNVDAVLPGAERYDEEPTSAASGFELGGFGSDDGFATNGFAADGPGFDNNNDDVAWGFGSSWAGDDSGTWGASEPIATVPVPAQSADVAELLTRAHALADRADISAFELIQLVNRELNYRGQAYYEIPYDPSRYPVETREELGNLISQYLLLYSGNMDDFADDALEPMQARMRVQLRSTSARAVEPLIDEINAYAAATLPPGYTVTIAGIAVVENAVTSLITDAQIRSIIVSLSLVFVIVAFTFRSFVAGLYSIVPLGLTLLINFAIMGFAGITLDVATAMVSSVAIGIGIDYTIHFLSGYKRERLRYATVPEAERATLRTTGRAITFNAVSVAAGFAVLIFSRFNPLMNMGILIALTMVTSSIASMTILPALLDLFRPRFIST